MGVQFVTLWMAAVFSCTNLIFYNNTAWLINNKASLGFHGSEIGSALIRLTTTSLVQPIVLGI